MEVHTGSFEKERAHAVVSADAVLCRAGLSAVTPPARRLQETTTGSSEHEVLLPALHTGALLERLLAILNRISQSESKVR